MYVYFFPVSGVWMYVKPTKCSCKGKRFQCHKYTSACWGCNTFSITDIYEVAWSMILPLNHPSGDKTKLIVVPLDSLTLSPCLSTMRLRLLECVNYFVLIVTSCSPHLKIIKNKRTLFPLLNKFNAFWSSISCHGIVITCQRPEYTAGRLLLEEFQVNCLWISCIYPIIPTMNVQSGSITETVLNAKFSSFLKLVYAVHYTYYYIVHGYT